jgi:outer membrane protein assembly factor BamA
VKKALRFLGLTAALFGICAGLATASPEDYAGRPIKTIEYRPEQQPYPPETLANFIGMKPGEPPRLESVRTAIERMHATGRYEDIEVGARLEQGDVILTFTTRVNFFVGRVTVQHVSAPPSAGVLANATRLELGTLFTTESTDNAVRNLQTELQQAGTSAPTAVLSVTDPEHWYDGTRCHVHFTPVDGATSYDVWVSPYQDGRGAMQVGKAWKESGGLIQGLRADTTFYAFVVYTDKDGKLSKPSKPLAFSLKDLFGYK